MSKDHTAKKSRVEQKEKLKIVVIGGGTGSYTVLQGLKQYDDISCTAIVSMFDSGGSTGRLRDEFGQLPKGDIRRCILALAPETTDTKILRQLLDFRFNKGHGLDGHSFGNLLMLALQEITQNEYTTIQETAKLLQCKGQVLPVSVGNAHLCAELEDGTVLIGEAAIDVPSAPRAKIKRVFLDEQVHALQEAIDAIMSADIIVLGPGDIYTSIIPNLLIDGISQALQQTHAHIAYIVNVMTKHGESDQFTASDFVKTIEAQLGTQAIDTVICNNTQISKELQEKYLQEYSEQVHIDEDNISYPVLSGDLLHIGQFVRHDSKKLAAILRELAKVYILERKNKKSIPLI